MLIQFLMAYSHPHTLTSCSTILDGLQPSSHFNILFYNALWSTTIHTGGLQPPPRRGGRIVKGCQKHSPPRRGGRIVYGCTKHTPPPRRGGRIVKGGRAGPMLIQFLMAYSHPHTLTSCSTILDGLQPSTHYNVLFYNALWSTTIPTDAAKIGNRKSQILPGLRRKPLMPIVPLHHTADRGSPAPVFGAGTYCLIFQLLLTLHADFNR